MRKLTFLCFGILLIGLFSCARNTLNAPEYIKYVESTKLNRTDSIKMEAYTISLVRTPLDYYLASNVLAGDLTKKQVQEEQNNGGNISFFGMLVECRNGGLFDQSTWEKPTQMRYYATDFKNNIKAITQTGDTLDCQNYVFQAGANFGSRSYFEFEFPVKESKIANVILLIKPISEQALVCKIQQLTSVSQPILKIK